MNLRLKRGTHLARGSAELNRGAPCGLFCDLKTLSRQPIGNRLNVSIGWTKLRTELGGCQPFMIIGRSCRLLIFQQLAQRRFLIVASLQKNQHPRHRLRISQRSLIVLSARQRMNVARCLHGARFIDRPNNPRAHLGFLCIGLGRKERCCRTQELSRKLASLISC